MADLERLNDSIEELERQSLVLRNYNEVYAEIAGLKQEILEILQLLEQRNQDLTGIAENVEGMSSKVETCLNDLEVKLEDKIDQIHSDNKSYQRELQSVMSSQLEKHKSDIQIDIRNETAQIQRGVETTMESSFNSMTSTLRDEFDKQTRQFQSLKTFTLVVIAASLGILGFVFGVVLILFR